MSLKVLFRLECKYQTKVKKISRYWAQESQRSRSLYFGKHPTKLHLRLNLQLCDLVVDTITHATNRERWVTTYRSRMTLLVCLESNRVADHLLLCLKISKFREVGRLLLSRTQDKHTTFPQAKFSKEVLCQARTFIRKVQRYCFTLRDLADTSINILSPQTHI